MQQKTLPHCYPVWISCYLQSKKMNPAFPNPIPIEKRTMLVHHSHRPLDVALEAHQVSALVFCCLAVGNILVQNVDYICANCEPLSVHAERTVQPSKDFLQIWSRLRICKKNPQHDCTHSSRCRKQLCSDLLWHIQRKTMSRESVKINRALLAPPDNAVWQFLGDNNRIIGIFLAKKNI